MSSLLLATTKNLIYFVKSPKNLQFHLIELALYDCNKFFLVDKNHFVNWFHDIINHIIMMCLIIRWFNPIVYQFLTLKFSKEYSYQIIHLVIVRDYSYIIHVVHKQILQIRQLDKTYHHDCDRIHIIKYVCGLSVVYVHVNLSDQSSINWI